MTPKLVKTECEVPGADQPLTCSLNPRVREETQEGLCFPHRNSNLCSRKCCGRRQQGGAALKRAAICVRVSAPNRTRCGDGFGQNPEAQELLLRQMAPWLGSAQTISAARKGIAPA